MEQEDSWLLNAIREIEGNREIRRTYQSDPFRQQESYPTYSARQSHNYWHTGRNLFDQSAHHFNEVPYRYWAEVEAATSPTRWGPSSIEAHIKTIDGWIEETYIDYLRRASGLYFDELTDAEWNPNRTVAKEEKPPAAADLPPL